MERAALIYQHEARDADKRITGAIDAHVQAERDKGDDDDGSAGALVLQPHYETFDSALVMEPAGAGLVAAAPV